MIKIQTQKTFLIMQAIIFSFIASIMFISSATAAVVHYTLDNVIQDNTQQLTGSFNWTYQEGDFENGSGSFTDLYIPGYGSDISALTISFDISKSIEFSLTANLDNNGVNVSLFLFQPLTATTSALIDTGISSYEIEVGGQKGGFISGSVSPVVVPLPASLWLFGSGLIGLTSISRRKHRNS